MFSKKRHRLAAVTDSLAHAGTMTAKAAHAATDLGASGAKLAGKMRAASLERLQDLKLPDQIQLPDLTLPKLQLGDVRREDVQLPDITLPRFNAGAVAVKDIQLPDITVPRFSMGKMSAKEVDLRSFGSGAAGGFRRLIRLTIFALVGLAVAKEMSQPEEQRQWNGRVLGVPYDFRPPTLQRFRDAFWNEDAVLVTPTPWGVGWAINVHALIKLAEEKATPGTTHGKQREVSRTSEEVRG